MFNNIQIGERIKRKREEREYTQLFIAEVLGTSRHTVINWEIGKNAVPADKLLQMCQKEIRIPKTTKITSFPKKGICEIGNEYWIEMFDCDTDYILGETDIENNRPDVGCFTQKTLLSVLNLLNKIEQELEEFPASYIAEIEAYWQYRWIEKAVMQSELFATEFLRYMSAKDTYEKYKMWRSKSFFKKAYNRYRLVEHKESAYKNLWGSPKRGLSYEQRLFVECLIKEQEDMGINAETAEQLAVSLAPCLEYANESNSEILFQQKKSRLLVMIGEIINEFECEGKKELIDLKIAQTELKNWEEMESAMDCEETFVEISDNMIEHIIGLEDKVKEREENGCKEI